MSRARGDDEERELGMDLMRADIATKNPDTRLKEEQRRWEPWQALSAAFGAGVAVTSALFAVLAGMFAHIVH